MSTRNVALLVAYDGTNFVGSQLQHQGRSVQGVLEAAWEALTQEQRRVILAGRTDAGVHAHGQVANVRTQTAHSTTTVRRALNAHLPDDVRVLDVQDVALDFHSRFTAVRREYRYLIDNALVPQPLLRTCVLHVEQPLDVQAMQEALALLLGQHDFAAFAATTPDQRSTVRELYRAKVETVTMLDRQLIAVELAANAFLHHMVRVIVGTLLNVGRNRMTVAEFEQVLRGRDRRAAGPTAAAHGLALVAVEYPSEQVLWALRWKRGGAL
ncbi:tRNA pseudouridine(38-40) synthase TruA [Candidatus Gracilibacteria bacterium]|nr:tRNA pseudouridine(38-40) synthase TruA [Candidatus Gracilibacteria bacterium]